MTRDEALMDFGRNTRNAVAAASLVLSSFACSNADDSAAPVSAGASEPAPDFASAVPKYTLSLGGGDFTAFGTLGELLQNTPVIVRVSVDGAGEYVGTIDDSGETAVYGQTATVVEVVRGTDIVRARSGGVEAVQILNVGPNVRNDAVRGALEDGDVALNARGIGVLDAGNYVLFLQPAGSISRPGVDYSKGFTFVGLYQGAVSLRADLTLDQLSDAPTGGSVDGLRLSADAREKLGSYPLERVTVEGVDGLSYDELAQLAQAMPSELPA